jgi:hypothetical protein
MEANLLCHAASFFIQAVSKSMHNALHDDPAV